MPVFAGAMVAAGLVASGCALAQTAGASRSPASALTPNELLYLALIALLIGTAMLTAVWLVRQRAAMIAETDELRAALAESRLEAEARAALLAGDGDLCLVYSGPGEPEVLGALRAAGAPEEPKRFLSFASWLPAGVAQDLAVRIERLRAGAEPFSSRIDVPRGGLVEASGKTVGGQAIVRFAPLTGLREELARLQGAHERAVATVATLQNLFDAAPMPAWLRDNERRLAWVNAPYARAVDAATPAEALERQAEFFGEQDRGAILAGLSRDGLYDDRRTAVVDGDRRSFSVVDAVGPFGSAGLAIDISESESVRMELRQTIASQGETLDHLTTAVARFDDKTQLTYYNAAFQKLFDLSPVYLDSAPDHVAMIDNLRSRGTLPMDRPLRELKNEIQAAYRATQPVEALWHLADGRTLRVFASPQPQGGTTWVFEDLTEKIELESRLNSLVRLQGETLDYLNEAVAVFGQDGRLRLSNPTFAETWNLPEEFLASRPRVQALAETTPVTIRPQAGNEDAGPDWSRFILAITSFDEGQRESESGELELSDGRVMSYGIVPLPAGQTMLTFSDISTARQAERMLREKNEALEQANQIKNDFVQHVNYELRSPLTNIIGFSALLRSIETGPLNARQSEYLDYISTSTAALLTIVNDILDLATIDAGIMDLDLSEVDIARTAEHAAESMRDRLRENEVALHVDVAAAGKSFVADGHRVTQILFNLLSNAANFAPAGSIVELRAERDRGDVLFSVTDRGPGIASDQIDRIFERFESNPAGGRKSGAGLGLSIVKSFVELHGGSIAIRSELEEGTTVVCRFPADPQPSGRRGRDESDAAGAGPQADEARERGRAGTQAYEDAAE